MELSPALCEEIVVDAALVRRRHYIVGLVEDGVEPFYFVLGFELDVAEFQEDDEDALLAGQVDGGVGKLSPSGGIGKFGLPEAVCPLVDDSRVDWHENVCGANFLNEALPVVGRQPVMPVFIANKTYFPLTSVAGSNGFPNGGMRRENQQSTKR